MRKIHLIITISAFLLTLTGVISGCGQNRAGTYPIVGTALLTRNSFGKNSGLDNKGIVVIEPVKVPLTAQPSSVNIPMPAASGKSVRKNDKAEIDYSNTKDGYIMVRYLGKADKVTRAIVKAPSGESYTYSINSNKAYECFPLSEGNGSYQIGIYENIKGSKYSTVISATIKVSGMDEFAPFLRPNQYVNYSSESKTVKKAVELVKDSSGVVDKISSVYSYIKGSITYDKELAKTVQSGYLPDADTVLAKGKGICFDYAAVMTTMLRSQQIPTKLVIGYAGNAYHAWINVYSKETGWIDKAIYFDGTKWMLMDPTFAANKIVENEKYTAKLIY